MKRLITILRYGVGLLFIFSGLVKANDPLGLAYKMEEYFEILHLYALIPYANIFSVSMNVLEIASGFALCIGWQHKWNLRLLLSLILFFTVLTGYTFYTGYPKTCGCFGDCLPIDASSSFFKDLILLGAIVFLLIKAPTAGIQLPGRVTTILVSLVTILSIGLQFYVLHHLPLIDCLPYKIGTNIPEARKQPPPPPGSTVMFVYEKNGAEVEFSADRFPEDFSADTYRFIRRYETGEIQQAPIQGFALYTISGADTTASLLDSDKLLLLFTQQVTSLTSSQKADWNNLYERANKKNIPLVLITNRMDRWDTILQKIYPTVRVVSCDRTPIRTAARVDPTVYYLEKGTVIRKNALADCGSLLKVIN
jgi:uncharacterized membrane protein YphA (DoxX/SURF4 family)